MTTPKKAQPEKDDAMAIHINWGLIHHSFCFRVASIHLADVNLPQYKRGSTWCIEVAFIRIHHTPKTYVFFDLFFGRTQKTNKREGERNRETCNQERLKRLGDVSPLLALHPVQSRHKVQRSRWVHSHNPGWHLSWPQRNLCLWLEIQLGMIGLGYPMFLKG